MHEIEASGVDFMYFLTFWVIFCVNFGRYSIQIQNKELNFAKIDAPEGRQWLGLKNVVCVCVCVCVCFCFCVLFR